jgi:hypothetical protein
MLWESSLRNGGDLPPERLSYGYRRKKPSQEKEAAVLP